MVVVKCNRYLNHSVVQEVVTNHREYLRSRDESGKQRPKYGVFSVSTAMAVPDWADRSPWMEAIRNRNHQRRHGPVRRR